MTGIQTPNVGQIHKIQLPLFSFDIKSHIQYAKETDRLEQEGKLIWVEYTRQYPEKIFGLFDKVVFKKFGGQKIIEYSDPCHIKLSSTTRVNYSMPDLSLLVDWLSSRQDHTDPWDERDEYSIKQGKWRGRTFILNKKGSVLDARAVETMVILRLNSTGILEMCILNVNKINLN